VGKGFRIILTRVAVSSASTTSRPLAEAETQAARLWRRMDGLIARVGQVEA